MRLTILGGGGFRVPLIYRALLADRAEGRVTHVRLHDLDESRLPRMARYVEHVSAVRGVPLAVRTTTDRRVGLTGGDRHNDVHVERFPVHLLHSGRRGDATAGLGRCRYQEEKGKREEASEATECHGTSLPMT